MKHMIFRVVFTITLLIAGVLPAFAQEQLPITEPVITDTPLQAFAGEDRNVPIGRKVLFDASGSTIPQNASSVQYRWDFGDGQTTEGIDAAHTYSQGGVYRVKLTVIAQRPSAPEERSAAEVIVSVQERLLVLITDQTVKEEQIRETQRLGLTKDTLVIPIRAQGLNQEYLTVQNLAQQILENGESISAADVIMTWTAPNIGMNAFIELSQIASLNNTSAKPLENLQLNNKVIIAVDNQSLVSSATIAQAAFLRIRPLFMVVANANIIDDIVANPKPETLVATISSSDAKYQFITEYSGRGIQRLGLLNFMSYALNYMINKGVPVNAIFLTLMLPVMATVIAFARQIIGLRGLGIFVPTIIALTFLSTGLKYGLPLFILVILVGTLARLGARKLRLLYMPRMAIVLSILALAIFVMLLIGSVIDARGLLSIAIFPILVMTVLAEHFVAVQIEQGTRSAVKLTLETLLLSIIGYLIADWTVFKTTILAFPEIVLLTLVINFILGRFAGLRVSEYLRFRHLLKSLRHAPREK